MTETKEDIIWNTPANETKEDIIWYPTATKTNTTTTINKSGFLSNYPVDETTKASDIQWIDNVKPAETNKAQIDKIAQIFKVPAGENALHYVLANTPLGALPNMGKYQPEQIANYFNLHSSITGIDNLDLYRQRYSAAQNIYNQIDPTNRSDMAAKMMQIKQLVSITEKLAPKGITGQNGQLDKVSSMLGNVYNKMSDFKTVDVKANNVKDNIQQMQTSIKNFDQSSYLNLYNNLDYLLQTSQTDIKAIATTAIGVIKKVDMGAVLTKLKNMFSTNIKPVDGKVVLGYGDYIDPISGKELFSRGVNIEGRRGQDVYAMTSGTVEHIGNNGSYGNMIIIKHKDDLYGWYCVCDEFEVEEGQTVAKGQKIATMGSNQFHFETRISNVIDDSVPAMDPQLFFA